MGELIGIWSTDFLKDAASLVFPSATRLVCGSKMYSVIFEPPLGGIINLIAVLDCIQKAVYDFVQGKIAENLLLSKIDYYYYFLLLESVYGTPRFLGETHLQGGQQGIEPASQDSYG